MDVHKDICTPVPELFVKSCETFFFFFKELEQYGAVDSAWTFIDRATFILNFGTYAYQLETFNKIIDLQASVYVQGDTDEEQQ